MKINARLSLSGFLVLAVTSLTVVHVASNGLSNQELLQGRQVFTEICSSCHGELAQGKIAPNLTKNIKSLSEAEFTEIVANGRGLMPAWKSNQDVMHNMHNMYRYLNVLSNEEMR